MWRVASIIVLLSGCGEPSAGVVDAGTPASDAGADAGVPPLPELDWSEVLAFLDTMKSNAMAFTVSDGHWAEEFGDAAFYGPGFYVRTGAPAADETALGLASAGRAYDRALVEQATADLDFYTMHMEEVFMAALGLLEYADQTGDLGDLPAIDALLSKTNDLLHLFRDYLNPDQMLGAFALDTYGPTTITAAVALVNLQHAKYFEGAERQAHVDRARAIVQAIDRNAWNEQGGFYLFRPGEPRVDLYPNAMMTLVLCRLYELTGERPWLDRSIRMFEAIQPLRQPAGNYYSQYSAEHMGARTTDYSTLSSQNYLSMALVLLYEDTRDPRYLVEAKAVMDFLRTHVYDPMQGRLLHHWIDGRIALPADPEYFCAGCNLQFLYVGWYLRTHILEAR